MGTVSRLESGFGPVRVILGSVVGVVRGKVQWLVPPRSWTPRRSVVPQGVRTVSLPGRDPSDTIMVPGQVWGSWTGVTGFSPGTPRPGCESVAPLPLLPVTPLARRRGPGPRSGTAAPVRGVVVVVAVDQAGILLVRRSRLGGVSPVVLVPPPTAPEGRGLPSVLPSGLRPPALGVVEVRLPVPPSGRSP